MNWKSSLGRYVDGAPRPILRKELRERVEKEATPFGG